MVFPRVKSQLLQLNEKNQATFSIPTIEEITEQVLKAKETSREICPFCDITLRRYADQDLVLNVEKVVHDAVDNDHEEDNLVTYQENNANLTAETANIIMIQEDL